MRRCAVTSAGSGRYSWPPSSSGSSSIWTSSSSCSPVRRRAWRRLNWVMAPLCREARQLRQPGRAAELAEAGLLAADVRLQRLGERRRGGAALGAAGEEADGGEDDEAGHDLPRADRLADEEPAEEDGDRRVDVGVRRDEWRRRVLHEPAVGREGEQRAGDDEEGEGAERGRGGHGGALAEADAEDREAGARGEHLRRRREQRVRGQRRDARVGGAGGPGEGGDEQRGSAERVDVARGADEQRDAEQADADAGERHALAEADAIDQGDEERHRGDDERGGAGGDPLLGPGDEARVDDEQGGAGDRGRAPLAQRRLRRAAAARPGVEGGAGEQETRREHEERRQRPVRDGDREVGRAPDDVDREECDEQFHLLHCAGRCRSAQMQLLLMSMNFRNVELRYLAALEAVGRTHSFIAAARELGYTQSAISQQIARLEQAVGQRLVERPGGPRPVTLTEAGTLLLRHADAIVAQLDAAQADMAAPGGGAGRAPRGGHLPKGGARHPPR